MEPQHWFDPLAEDRDQRWFVPPTLRGQEWCGIAECTRERTSWPGEGGANVLGLGGVTIGQVKHLPEMINEGVIRSHGGPILPPHGLCPLERPTLEQGDDKRHFRPLRQVVMSLHIQDESALEKKAAAGRGGAGEWCGSYRRSSPRAGGGGRAG